MITAEEKLVQTVANYPRSLHPWMKECISQEVKEAAYAGNNYINNGLRTVLSMDSRYIYVAAAAMRKLDYDIDCINHINRTMSFGFEENRNRNVFNGVNELADLCVKALDPDVSGILSSKEAQDIYNNSFTQDDIEKTFDQIMQAIKEEKDNFFTQWSFSNFHVRNKVVSLLNKQGFLSEWDLGTLDMTIKWNLI